MEFSGNVFQRFGSHLLSGKLAGTGHTEKDKTTEAVKHSAGRFCRFGPLPGGTFEFDTLRLAAENQFFQFVDIHPYLPVFRVLIHPMGIT